MATDIKRVRFFDGQFLKEGDFQAEQQYHSHLRRRLNFLLFQQSGVVAMTPTDLTLELVNAADKTFRIKAGTAIAQNLKEQEGREIILRDDSAPIDLDAAGISAGQTAAVSLHWEEVTSDLSTEGESSQDTRFSEQAIINVALVKPTTPGATGDPYVQLGTIVYNSMTISSTGREVALLRSALIPVTPAPIITNVGGTTSAVTGPASMTILGSNLSGATLVTFLDPMVTAALGANTATTLDVTVNIALGTTPGAKGFTVSTPSGVGLSPGGVAFTVLPPLPVITGMVGTPLAVAGGASISMTINGTDLGGATVSFPGSAGVSVLPGAVATATSVTFQVQVSAVEPAGLKQVRVDTAGGSAVSSAPTGLTVLLAPTITSLSGVTSIVADGVAVPGIVINGTSLTGGALSFPTEPSMIIAGPLVNGAGTQLTVSLTAPVGMTPGLKSYRVTTVAGPVDSAGAARLSVTAPVPAPTITAITPDNGGRGTTVSARIDGTNLTGASSVTFAGAGITVTIGTVNLAGTALTISIAIAAGAGTPLGNRSFSVTTTPGNTGNSPTGVNFNVTP